MRIVHFMQYGMTACMKPGPPEDWPDNEAWDGDWTRVNCPECLKGKSGAKIETFKISEDGNSITCLRCKHTSHHPKDIELHYCGHCHAFHDDIWPPARHWWVTHPDPEPPEKRILPLRKPE